MCLCPISSSTLGGPLLLTLTPENKAIRADVASLQSDKDKAITDLKSAANDNLWLAHLLQGKGYNNDLTLFSYEKADQARELARLQHAAAAHLVQTHKDGIVDTHLSFDRRDDAARALERGAIERICKETLEKMKRFADRSSHSMSSCTSGQRSRSSAE